MQKMLNKIDKAILKRYEAIKQSGKILFGIEDTYRQIGFKNPELAVHIKKKLMQIAKEKGDLEREVGKTGRNRASKFLDEIMNLMEERGFEQWEAEWVARKLPGEIKENSRRKESHQPFTVFRWDQ